MNGNIAKTLYLVRHGETDPNKNHIIQGSGIDAPLNETGQRQAKDFYFAYRHISFDKVYTSHLIRTHQSVRWFTEKGIPHDSLTDLREISWGEKDGTRIDPAEQRIYQAMLKDWQAGLLDRSFSGGESPYQVVARMKTAMQTIMEREEEKTILMCIHGRAMRILLSMLMQTPLSEMEQYLHSNLCLYILEYDGQKWKICLENDTSHLL
jgi:broad specificity phosphatase PhoE